MCSLGTPDQNDGNVTCGLSLICASFGAGISMSVISSAQSCCLPSTVSSANDIAVLSGLIERRLFLMEEVAKA